MNDRGKGCCKEGITSHLPSPHPSRPSEKRTRRGTCCCASSHCQLRWVLANPGLQATFTKNEEDRQSNLFSQRQHGRVGGEHHHQLASKNVRQITRFLNKKVKYADVVCNSSPATKVTGIVKHKCFYLIQFFSLVKISKIYTKPRKGLEEKDPNKQLLTNGRSLHEETVAPVKLACKQKALFIAVIVPPNTLSQQIRGLIFLQKSLNVHLKSQSLWSQRTISISLSTA